VHSFVNDLLRPVGVYVYGRRMHETMVGPETMDTAAQEPLTRRPTCVNVETVADFTSSRLATSPDYSNREIAYGSSILSNFAVTEGAPPPG
jgi:hypothetical protein